VCDTQLCFMDEAMPVCSLWRARQRKEYIDRMASMSTDSRAFIEECSDDYLKNWCKVT